MEEKILIISMFSTCHVDYDLQEELRNRICSIAKEYYTDVEIFDKE